MVIGTWIKENIVRIRKVRRLQMEGFKAFLSNLRYVIYITIVGILVCGGIALTTGKSDTSQNVSEESEEFEDEVPQTNRFEIIEVDNSSTLNVDDVDSNPYTKYAYLNDTGVVYIGVGFETFVNNSWCTPVISPNGNYYIYNTETKSVEEIIKQ